MWKSKWKMNKERWMLLMAAGAALMILAMPVKEEESVSAGALASASSMEEAEVEEENVSAGASPAVLSASDSYEARLEQRVKDILKNVEGVGTVDVMIVLKSTEEKILHLDKSSSRSDTEEKDSAGGSRSVKEGESRETAVLAGQTGNGEPIVSKELYPEISGIVISASGGGSARVQAEITAAMEALFGLLPNKVKVLKRTE